MKQVTPTFLEGESLTSRINLWVKADFLNVGSDAIIFG